MSVPSDLIERARGADLIELAQGYGVTLKRAATNEFAGPCPNCGGRDRFSINVKKRLWHCRQCSRRGDGDPISLVQRVENVSFGEAVARLAGASWTPVRAAGPIHTAARVEASDDRADDVAKARQRWSEGVDPRQTIVEKYLVGRGLKLTDDITGEVIRFHPGCPWKDDDASLIRVPAMICAMRDIRTGKIVAVSRRRLTPEGEKVGKPRFLGAAAGAAIKLDADEDVTTGLHVCEGCETGVAGRMRNLKPMWALGSKDAIKNFPVLGGIDCLTILAEPDAESQVEKCARRWYEAGREVILNRSRVGKDLADAVASGRL